MQSECVLDDNFAKIRLSHQHVDKRNTSLNERPFVFVRHRLSFAQFDDIC